MAATKQFLPDLPIGISNWQVIRDDKMFFVDKTALLGDLVTNQRKIFLSRPRRMGKSLLISSLKNLFTNGDKNFEGTAIYGNWPYSETYPVIHLSFNQVEGIDAQSYAQSLKGAITEAYRAAGFYQVEEYEQEDLTLNRFLNKVGRISDETRLVFLIDEWDYALSSNLNNVTLFNDVLSVLKTFYSWLRGIDSTRFILITGIMRYDSVSLFSGQDIQDISMEPQWSSLLGLTHNELITCYAPYISEAARRLNLSDEQLIAELKSYYDGFCFDYNASVHLYCPFAINKFFAPTTARHSQQLPRFTSYWMTNSNAAQALKSYLRSIPFNISEDYNKLTTENITLTESECINAVSFSQVKLLPLLAQAGYLTIKEVISNSAIDNLGINDNKPQFRFGYPNRDVSTEFKTVFNNFINESINSLENDRILKAALLQSLEANKFDQSCDQLNELISGILFDAFTDAHEAHEAHYRTIFTIWLRDIFKDVREETPNARGRSDIELTTTKGQVIVFELKLLNDLKSEDIDYSSTTTFEAIKDSILEPARMQVLSRGYGVNYHNEGKPVVGVLMAISAKERRIVAWREFNPDPNIGVREGRAQAINMHNKHLAAQAIMKTTATI